MAGTCHVLWGVYGLWLPRRNFRSWSEQVTHWELALYGRTLSPMLPSLIEPTDYALSKQAAMRSLKAESVCFSPAQRNAMAEAMSNFVRRHRVVIRACAILPKHVQVVLDVSPFERVDAAPALRAELTRRMHRSHRRHPELVPLAQPAREDSESLAAENLETVQPESEADTLQGSYWNRAAWKSELKDNQQIRQAITYVNNLPQQEQLEPQTWSFVSGVSSILSCRETQESYGYSSKPAPLALAG